MEWSERVDAIERRLRLLRRTNPIALIAVYATVMFVVFTPLFILAGGQSVVRGTWQSFMLSSVIAAVFVYATRH